MQNIGEGEGEGRREEGKKGRRDEGKKGRREEGKKGRREEGKKGRRKKGRREEGKKGREVGRVPWRQQKQLLVKRVAKPQVGKGRRKGIHEIHKSSQVCVHSVCKVDEEHTLPTCESLPDITAHDMLGGVVGEILAPPKWESARYL
jgi:hypothetical protein